MTFTEFLHMPLSDVPVGLFFGVLMLIFVAMMLVYLAANNTEG